ncbi:hypothetical protein ACQ3G6_13000 [Allorhizobium undicola]|uniref:hypothetical protein n=1 Tax=Allorhizobium undicola TaxID=78527 RepID=UPI003D328A4D
MGVAEKDRPVVGIDLALDEGLEGVARHAVFKQRRDHERGNWLKLRREERHMDEIFPIVVAGLVEYPHAIVREADPPPLSGLVKGLAVYVDRRDDPLLPCATEHGCDYSRLDGSARSRDLLVVGARMPPSR